jgi:hypothetical protein
MQCRIVIALAAVLFVAGGCANTNKLSADELAKPELQGGPPSSSQIEADIKAVMKTQLFDPYSAVYEFGAPYAGKAWGGAFGGGWKYGYIVEYTVNAKNRFGGYVGAKPYTAVFQNGRLLGVKPEYVPTN